MPELSRRRRDNSSERRLLVAEEEEEPGVLVETARQTGPLDARQQLHNHLDTSSKTPSRAMTAAQADAKSREAAMEQRARSSTSEDNHDSANSFDRSRPVQPPSRPSSAGSNVSSILTPTTPRSRSPVRWPVPSEQTPLLDAGQAPPPSYDDATAGRSVQSDRVRGDRDSGSRNGPSSRVADNTTQDHQASRSAGYGSIQPSVDDTEQQQQSDDAQSFPNQIFGPNFPFGSHGGPFGENGPFGPHGPFGQNGFFRGRGPFGQRRSFFRGHRQQSMQDDIESDCRHHRHHHHHHHRRHSDERRANGFIRPEPRKGGKGRGCCTLRNICHLFLTIAIILIVILIAQMIYFSNVRGRQKNDPNKNLPISDPHQGIGTPPQDPNLQHPDTDQCHFLHLSQYYIHQFKLTDMIQPTITLLELIEPSHHISGGVTGTIEVVPIDETENFDVLIITQMATTNPWQIRRFDIIRTNNALEIREPEFENVGNTHEAQPCLNVAVKVYVRKSILVDNFEISTLNLDIAGSGSLFEHDIGVDLDTGFTIANSSRLSTVKGNIDMPYWRSRETYVSTTSGSISGAYALMDVLSVRSISGTVNINVNPQKVDISHPKPASFKTSTQSGSITVAYITHNELPDRDYKTEVQSVSGTLRGSFLMSSEASFRTISGTMHLKVTPFEIGQKISQLTTSSHSGTLHLELTSPYMSDAYFRSPAEAERSARQANGIFDTGMLSHMNSSHTSSSASLSIAYPDEWTGRISGQSVSGTVKLRGEKVKVDVADDIPGLKRYIAHKEHGDSKIVLQTISGTVDFLAGFAD